MSAPLHPRELSGHTCPDCNEPLVEQRGDDGEPFWVCPVCSGAFDLDDLARFA